MGIQSVDFMMHRSLTKEVAIDILSCIKSDNVMVDVFLEGLLINDEIYNITEDVVEDVHMPIRRLKITS